MPTNLFFELDHDKREKIFNASLFEFSAYGYTSGSTNRIARNADISKGSLFKYFESKEELFFYVLDMVVEELTSSVEEIAADLPLELFQKVIKYSEFELSWYIKYPQKYRLIINAFAKDNTDIHRKIEERYSSRGKSIYFRIMDNVDISQFKCDKEKVIHVIKWVLDGLNTEFIHGVLNDDSADVSEVRDRYIEYLTAYLDVLKLGLSAGRETK